MSHEVAFTPKKFIRSCCNLAVISSLLSACSSMPDIPKQPPPVFPPPPAEPRFVYEATLQTSSNITEPSFSDKLREIATGETVAPFGLAKPYGVVVKNGRVFISDTQQRAIMMFDLINRNVKLIGTSGKGNLLKPLGLDISPENELFVADLSARRIVVFDLEGNFLRAIGNKKLFTRPVSASADPTSNKLYVVDTGGVDSDDHHVLVFDRTSGKHIQTLGKRGRTKKTLNIPLQSTVTNDGILYVVDSGNFRVQKISKDGEFIGSIGSIGRRGGQFSRPKGIASDNDGNIYVVDTAFGNVQIFNSNGKLLMHLGKRTTRGGPGAYSLPAGIDVDEDGKIYIVDQFFSKVEIIRPINAKPFDVFIEE